MLARFRRLLLEPLEERCCPATSGVPAADFDKLGAYRPSDGSWSLDANGDGHFGPEDTVYLNYSGPGVTPIVGDWDGSGRDEVGFFFDGIWSLNVKGNGNSAGDQVFDFGQEGDIPVVGDWTGDGKVKVGVFRDQGNGAGEFILDANNDHQLGAGDTTFTFGASHDRVVVGDWTGDGKAKVGVFRPNPDGSGSAIFSLDLNGNHHYDGAQESFVFGAATDGFVVGDWTHTGVKNLGVYRPNPDGSGTGYFTLDTNGNHQYDPGIDSVFTFGLASDTYIVGNWAYNPETAAFPAPSNSTPARLTQDALNAAVRQSLATWSQAGLDAQHVAQLANLDYQVADLPSGVLGVEKPDGIVIDATAAGFSWSTTATVNQMDLPSVVMHEQGHALGLPDQAATLMPNDLMADTLAPGVSRTPTAQDLALWHIVC